MLTRDGGSIPVIAQFKKVLNCDIVMMGFGLDSDAIHSPNEHVGVENFFKGIDAVIAFYEHLGFIYSPSPLCVILRVFRTKKKRLYLSLLCYDALCFHTQTARQNLTNLEN